MNSHVAIIALQSLWHKECVRFLRIWRQTIIPPAITMGLYFVIFGNLIGSRIGQMQGFSYMEYITPGLIMMSVITNAYSNVASSFFSSKFQRNVEELLVSPVPNYIIIIGYMGGGVARGLCVGLFVTFIALSFTQIQIQHISIVVITVILTAALFSIAGLINAIYANSFDQVSVIPNFILTPLTYLGGVFYSITLLPEFWQIVSKFNPIIYMVNAFRYGFLGVADVPLFHAFSILIFFIIILFSYALILLKRGTGLKH